MALALYREDATGFLVRRDTPGAGYTAISAMPTGSIAQRANWYRGLDTYGQSSAWHPSQSAPGPESADPNANYNNSNDQNGSAISAPTISGTGTAVDHTINTDGSANISFEWSWSGTESTIDGFYVFLYQSTSSAAYTFGTTPAAEKIYVVPASKRAHLVYGVPANQYYTWGVQAFRNVAPNVAGSPTIKSTLVKPSLAAENPYRPSANVAFAGDLTGTINNLPPGNLANKDTADYGTEVSGTKPPSDATRNVVTISSTAPASPQAGDIWYDTTAQQEKYWTGSSWQLAGTRNKTYNQGTTPSGAALGDLWNDTSTGALKIYNGSSWQLVQYGNGGIGDNSVDTRVLASQGATVVRGASGNVPCDSGVETTLATISIPSVSSSSLRGVFLVEVVGSWTNMGASGSSLFISCYEGSTSGRLVARSTIICTANNGPSQVLGKIDSSAPLTSAFDYVFTAQQSSGNPQSIQGAIKVTEHKKAQ